MSASSGAVRRPHQLRGDGGASEAKACFGGVLPSPLYSARRIVTRMGETLQSPWRRRGSGLRLEPGPKGPAPIPWEYLLLGLLMDAKLCSINVLRQQIRQSRLFRRLGGWRPRPLLPEGSAAHLPAVERCVEQDLRTCPETQAALNWLSGNGYRSAITHFRPAFTLHHPMEREAAATQAFTYLTRQVSRQSRPAT